MFRRFIRNLFLIIGIITFIACMMGSEDFSQRLICALCCFIMFGIPIKLLNKGIKNKVTEYAEADNDISYSEQPFQRDDALRSEMVKCSKCGTLGLSYKGRRTNCESCGTALRYPR